MTSEQIGIKITGNEGSEATAIGVASAIAMLLTVASESQMDQTTIVAALDAFRAACPNVSGYNTVSGASIVMHSGEDDDQ